MIKYTESKVLTEEFVKNALVPWLNKHDWLIVKIACLHERGADIIAQKRNYGRRYVIEVKGGSIVRGVNDAKFVHVLGQINTRMKTSGQTIYKYGIAVPNEMVGIPLKRIPWQLAKQRKIFILSVDKKKKVVEYNFKDMQKVQR